LVRVSPHGPEALALGLASGIGIAKNEINKIFNAYYRSPKAIRIEGDGIGLYIVKDNIEKIGGNISVTSKLNVGSTFTIEIPANYKY